MKSFQYFGIALAIATLAGSLQASPFDILFRVASPKGVCQVKTPEMTEFVPAIRNKAYPYGTTVQTVGPGSSVVLLLSENDAVRILEDTKTTLEKAPDAKNGKLIKLANGTILTRFSPTITNTPVFIDTPLGRAMEMLGNCKLVLSEGLSDSTLLVRAESNSQLKFIAPQLIIPVLRNGYGVSVTTTDDRSYTRVRNLLGDYRLFINTGLDLDPVLPAEDEGGTEYLLPIRTSSQSSISIWRENAPIGNRLIVSVLATDSDGKGSQSFAFAVGDPSITSRSQVQDIVEASTNAPAANAPAATEEKTEDPLSAFAETTDDTATEDAAETAEGAEETPAAEDQNALDEFLF